MANIPMGALSARQMELIQNLPEFNVTKANLPAVKTQKPQEEIDQENQNANLAEQKRRMITDYEGTARRALAERMAGTKQSAAGRGLLYSGLHMGQQAANQAGAAGASAAYRQKVNQAQQGQLSDLAAEGAALGLQEQQNAQERYNAEYKRALQRRAQEQQTASQLGSAAGGLLGFALPF